MMLQKSLFAAQKDRATVSKIQCSPYQILKDLQGNLWGQGLIVM